MERTGSAKEMRYSGRTSGFTLLELLVVMAIIGLGVTLAVPRMLATVEAVSADAEQRRLSEMVDQAGLHAYLRNEVFTFAFDGRVVSDDAERIITEFDHIVFPKQTIRWNTRGYADAGQLAYTIRGREKLVDLYR